LDALLSVPEQLRNIVQNAYNDWPVTVCFSDLMPDRPCNKEAANERKLGDGRFMNQPIKPPQGASSQTTSQRGDEPFGGPPKPRSAWRLVATFLVLLLIVAGIVWWSKQQAAPEGQGRGGRNAVPMSIVPETVGKGDIGINLNALGTVTSLATVTIRSQISGYLLKVDFKEGDEVKKGDLIAEIDPRPYEATLAQANGNLTRDRALLKGAQVDLTRYQGLAAQNAVPRQTLDTQVALVAQYQGTVEADTAAVKAAQVNLQYCHILSPLDGRVGLRQVDQGNYVTPGDTNGIVVITQLQPISVLFTVPEDNLQAISKRLQSGAVLPATALDRSGARKIADGTLQTFDSQIDQTTGTIKLRAQFPNEAKTLYPNQFVNVQLLLDTHNDVTTMPTAGVQRGVPGTFVYLVNADDTVSVRKIELGVTDGDRVEVRSGLQPGDRIVVDGADKLKDGAKINIRAEATDPNAPPAATGVAPEPEKTGKKQRSEGKKRDNEQKNQDDGQKQ
jgi:membrane fusion protein, multidrug efflux system